MDSGIMYPRSGLRFQLAQIQMGHFVEAIVKRIVYYGMVCWGRIFGSPSQP